MSQRIFGTCASVAYSMHASGREPEITPAASAESSLHRGVASRPDVVQRFIDASAEGWYSYLYGDPAPGNALIKKDNPQMEDDLLAHGVRTMRQYAMVTGGDAVKQGIMTMTDARWKQTFDFMVKAGMVDAKVDYRKAYSLDLVKDVKVLP